MENRILLIYKMLKSLISKNLNLILKFLITFNLKIPLELKDVSYEV